MPSYAETIAPIQPDDTQGIAKVELKNGSDELIAELVGCVIHLSKKDKSLRNILQVENIKMKYFIFVPWFHSRHRPTVMNENGTKIEVKLHRYRKKEIEKKFLVDENNSAGIFEKYRSDNYFVIPCPEFKNFKKSSFLKKWSSDLLLFNNSSQVSQSSDYFFYGIKKVDTSFEYCWVDEEFNELEKQGVLLIRSSNESYVIGCYEKENGRIKKYCFLLKGLEEIDETAGGTNSPPPEQSPSGRSEEGRHNPPPDQPSSRKSGEGGGNPPPDQPSSRKSGKGGGNPPPVQPKRLLWRNPALDEPQESEDGRIGSKLVVSGRHTSRPMNHEAVRAKTEKKELIHNKYGPRVVDMPHDVMHEVCLMLNPIQRIKFNDYRKVAEEIGLTYYEIKNLPKENPMEMVFELMINLAKKVDEFVDVLFKIGRGDVVDKMYDMTLHTQS